MMAEYRRVVSLDGSTANGVNQSTYTPTRNSSSRPDVPPRPPGQVTKKQSSVSTRRYKPSNRSLSLFGRPSKDNKKSHKIVEKPRGESNRGKEQNGQPKQTSQQMSRPTVIRPLSTQNKKRAPPRPPPPKINPGPANRLQRPPSYEDVMRSDIDTFITEMTKPRPSFARPSLKKSPPKAVPRNSDTDSGLLIDFGSPSSSPIRRTNPVPRTQHQSQSLLDLDDVFSCNEFAGGAFTTNSERTTNEMTKTSRENNMNATASRFALGPRVLPVGPRPTLHPARGSASSACSPMNLGTSSRSPTSTDSRGEDWLKQCLTNSQKGFTQTPHWQSSSLSTRDSVSPLPPLPPRPILSDCTSLFSSLSTGDYSDSQHGFSPTSSPEPPAMSPPPVPPLPSRILQGDSSPEMLPPLPPRPTEQEVEYTLHRIRFMYSWEKKIPTKTAKHLNRASEECTRPHAIAIYDYVARQDDELSFTENEMITLIHRVNKEWLYGYTNDHEGIFPESFVTTVVQLPDDREDDVVTGPFCQALYDFVAENDNELSFVAGDTIILESRENNDWLRGTSRGHTGIFPATFVQIVKDLPGDNGLQKTDFPQRANRYVALYDFEGEDGEVSFAAGDILIVTKTIDSDWFMGRLERETEEGRFPQNHVQLC